MYKPNQDMSPWASLLGLAGPTQVDADVSGFTPVETYSNINQEAVKEAAGNVKDKFKKKKAPEGTTNQTTTVDTKGKTDSTQKSTANLGGPTNFNSVESQMSENNKKIFGQIFGMNPTS